MIVLTPQQRNLLIAAIDLALNTWEEHPENATLNPIFDQLIRSNDTGDTVVMYTRPTA